MSDVKWIKIVTDIFDDEKILLIESLPWADSIIVIWFKLLCLAGKNNNQGVFVLNDKIPYTDEMLATIFRRDINTVRMAINTFQMFGMIEVVNGVITIPNWGKHQTLDSYEKKKERDRLYQAERRAKQKEIADKSSDKSSDVAISDIDKDKERDKEEERDNPPISPLWDFDKHSNVDNAKHLIGDNIYKNTEWFIEHQELWQVVTDWFEYKDSRKPKSSNHYSNEKSISNLLNQIVKACNEYGTDAVIEIINRSMASCYSGIVWDWLKNNQKQVGSISNRVSQVDNW